MQEHISTSFDNDLNDLGDMMAKIGGMVQTQLNLVLNSFDQGNDEVLKTIIETDKAIDALEHDIFNKTVEIIALRSPHAEDLRKVMIAPRIASSNERMGDLVRNIAKRLLSIHAEGQALPLADDMKSLGLDVLASVTAINDAAARSDVAKALEVWEGDIKIDESYDELIKAIVKLIDQNSHDAETMRHTMFIAKNIERIGDHATTIAELVHFRVEAVMLSEERPKLGDADA